MEYSILRPVQLVKPAVPDVLIWHQSQTIPPHRQEGLSADGTTVTAKDVSWNNQKKLLGLLPNIERADIVAFDFETEGTFVPSRQPTKNRAGNLKWCRPVGLALAWRVGGRTESAYLVLDGLGVAKLRQVYSMLASLPAKLMAHNLMFDGSIIARDLGYWPDNMTLCTFAMTKHWAGEGFDGQQWGLKYLQGKLLGWHSTNEGGIDGWLIRNGYYGTSTAADAYRWTNAKGEPMTVAPKKAEMWRCPPWVLGEYAKLDAVSTLDLYHWVLRPAIDKHGGPKDMAGSYEWFYSAFVTTIKECSQAYLTGFKADVEKMGLYWCDLHEKVHELEGRFLSHGRVAEHVAEYNRLQLEEHRAKEPARLKKDGTPSTTWSNWFDKYKEVKITQHFNLGSGPQLAWLFYERLGYPVEKTTAKGQPAVDNAVLATLGEVGKLRKEYGFWKKKLEGFVDPYVNEHLVKGRLHPGYQVPQALTGRLSSKEPNIQQVGKDRRMLELFLPEEGNVLVDADFSAIENIVLAELSGDENLLKLYGDGAPANDPHLFTAAGIRAFAEDIRAAGYDPNNPTAAGIAAAKRDCYKQRAAAKKVNYSIIYGVGARKLAMDLSMEGIETSKDEAAEMIRGWWQTYSGVAAWRRKLEQEWRTRGGWVRNGIGRPIAVAEDKLKDLISRVVQSTAHDCLTLYIDLLTKEREKRSIEMRLAIPDWHDQTMCETPAANAQVVADLMDKSVPQILNSILKGDITLKMEAAICETVADSKGV